MTTSLGSKNSLRSRTGQRRGQRIFGSNFGSCCWQDNDLPLALCPKLLDEQFFNTSSILMHFGIWPSILKLRTVRLCAAKWHISSSAKDESSYPKKLKKNMTNSLGSATWNNTWIEFFKHPALPSQCGNLRWGFQEPGSSSPRNGGFFVGIFKRTARCSSQLSWHRRVPTEISELTMAVIQCDVVSIVSCMDCW